MAFEDRVALGDRDLPHHAARMRADDMLIFIASITNSCWPWRTSSPSRTSIETIVPCMGAATATVFSGPMIS